MNGGPTEPRPPAPPPVADPHVYDIEVLRADGSEALEAVGIDETCILVRLHLLAGHDVIVGRASTLGGTTPGVSPPPI